MTPAIQYRTDSLKRHPLIAHLLNFETGGGGGARVHVTGADDDVTAAESAALSQQQKGKAHRTPRALQEVLSLRNLSRTETPRHHGRVRPAGMLSPARPRTALRPGAQGTRPDQSQGR
ncbi:hypothetical protein CEXT_511051 [Caerostris extrusa]|uniref:Uncharacterized protein n=1 Tax=Caerostris extrusa TaxID=172846 RepID=A0AAV4XL72_CAEEX|nr:hypothetical protein CEXT_511051 [Caerostris extrusa]